MPHDPRRIPLLGGRVLGDRGRVGDGGGAVTTSDFAEYRKIEAVNWSVLKEMRKSPLHYKFATENEVEDTPRFGVGRALHTMVLEPQKFAAEYAVYNGPRRAGGDWEVFSEEHAGKTILKRDEHANVMAMAKAIREHEAAKAYLGSPGALYERTIAWRDPTGVLCKGRPDLVSTVIGDVKTVSTVDERMFRSQATRLGYFGQLAFYRRGLRILTKMTLPCVILAVEDSDVHDVGVFSIDEHSLSLADEEITRMLLRVKECRESGVWPGRYPTERTLTMPDWGVEQQDEANTQEAA